MRTQNIPPYVGIEKPLRARTLHKEVFLVTYEISSRNTRRFRADEDGC